MARDLYLVKFGSGEFLVPYTDIFGNTYQDPEMISRPILICPKLQPKPYQESLTLPNNVELSMIVNPMSVTILLGECRYPRDQAHFLINVVDRQLSIDEMLESGIEIITFRAQIIDGQFTNSPVEIRYRGNEETSYRLCWWDTKYGQEPPFSSPVTAS